MLEGGSCLVSFLRIQVAEVECARLGLVEDVLKKVIKVDWNRS
jgi:hypothetical protein